MFDWKNFTLLPQPRFIEKNKGVCRLKSRGEIICRSNDLFPIAVFLQNDLRRYRKNWQIYCGKVSGEFATIVLEINSFPDLSRQGYHLTIEAEKVIIQGADFSGLFYGVMTLRQLLRQSFVLPCGIIRDWPDFLTRGVMVDISRSKVPTMESLFHLIDRLSEWKINHIELYVEHTFAYRNHQEVWAQSSPITGEQIMKLEHYCRERYIELVPNQNSFGHLQRWLELPAYNHLAECPNGFIDPWGKKRGAFSLDPTSDKSIEFLAQLFEELLPYFSSKKFNVGCDETFDLGKGKSKEKSLETSKGQVYLDFLLKIYQLVKKHGRIMHFWGDIILNYPHLISKLPGDMVGLIWGYEGDHPFDNQCRQFAEAKIPFYVCPGTSAWNTICGRTQNCLDNLSNAAIHGLKYGAEGFLNTDWGDNGHWQYLSTSFLGLAAASIFSWYYQEYSEDYLIHALDTHVFQDKNQVIARSFYDAGNLYRQCKPIHNSSLLFHLLFAEQEDLAQYEIDLEKLNELQEQIDLLEQNTRKASMQCPDAEIIQDEFTNTLRMLHYGIKRKILCLNSIRDKDHVMARDMRIILGEHRKLWLARNRPGGLQESTMVLQKRLAEHR